MATNRERRNCHLGEGFIIFIYKGDGSHLPGGGDPSPCPVYCTSWHSRDQAVLSAKNVV